LLTSQHFSAIQLEHGRNPNTDDLKALADSHTLLLNIFRFSPGLLLKVVPLLEANLKAADEIPLRQLSTRTLGRMFGERPVVGTGRADLAKAYPSAWRAWLGRKVDKALVVRLAWVESTRGILCNHPELRRELEGMFSCHSLVAEAKLMG
jgi:sister-chromatid-cohesion protein PDS5